MVEQMECMCLECGVSNYLAPDRISLEDPGSTTLKLLRSPFCTECGGPLVLIGKSGDEPYYKLKDTP